MLGVAAAARAREDAIGGEHGAHRGIEALAFDRAIIMRQPASMRGEADIIARPAVGNEGLDQRRIFGRDIAFEE